MQRTQRLSLVAAIMGSFVVGLDATVVNVALPAMEHDLGGGLAGQQWVANGYTLALASLILVGGSLGDVFGERRVFSIGVLGFGATSVLCAVAPSIEIVVVGRILQGVFGALLAPSALALIVAAFPPAERGGAIGSWTAWSGIATVIGPLVGGQLIDAASWRWIFAINIPFVVLTLVLVSVAVPRRPRATAHAPVDWPGAALSFLALAGPTLALIRQPTAGWGAPDVLVPGLAGLAFCALFIARERRARFPMLPLELFRRRNFSAGNIETFAMYAGLSILFFFLVLFLQQVAGYSALDAGLATMPVTIVMFLLSKRAGALADRFGPRFFMGVGPLIAAAGLLLLLRLDARVDYATDLLPALLLFSIGLSATVAPLTATVLADADEEHAGIASGVNNAIARATARASAGGRPRTSARASVRSRAESSAARARGDSASRSIRDEIAPLACAASTAPSAATPSSPAARAIALLTPEAMPACSSSASASTVAVSGATVAERPIENSSSAGRRSVA
ncbi:MAG: hypothetical protein QOJ89_1401 [bacterium]